MRFAADLQKRFWFVPVLKGRFFLLLISLLLVFLIYPLFETAGARFHFKDILFTVILLAAVYATKATRKIFIPVGIFGLLALTMRGFAFATSSVTFEIVSILGYVVFFFTTIVIILILVLRASRVTADTISGAICVYLLSGVTWASIYSVLELFHPGTFTFPASLQVSPEATLSVQTAVRNRALVYYSFVTLTTLGFGDITPATALARSLSTLEAVGGQLYLAVLIARLVGIHIVHSTAAPK